MEVASGRNQEDAGIRKVYPCAPSPVGLEHGSVTLGSMRNTNPDITDADLADRIVALLAERRPDVSICPSDVARSLSDDEATWRGLMPRIRDVAARLADDGVIRVTQGQTTIDLHQPVRGPIRLRRADRFDSFK